MSLTLPAGTQVQFNTGTISQYENLPSSSKLAKNLYLVDDGNKFYWYAGENPVYSKVEVASAVTSTSALPVTSQAVYNYVSAAFEVINGTSNSIEEADMVAGRFYYFEDGSIKFKYALGSAALDLTPLTVETTLKSNNNPVSGSAVKTALENYVEQDGKARLQKLYSSGYTTDLIWGSRASSTEGYFSLSNPYGDIDEDYTGFSFSLAAGQYGTGKISTSNWSITTNGEAVFSSINNQGSLTVAKGGSLTGQTYFSTGNTENFLVISDSITRINDVTVKNAFGRVFLQGDESQLVLGGFTSNYYLQSDGTANLYNISAGSANISGELTSSIGTFSTKLTSSTETYLKGYTSIEDEFNLGGVLYYLKGDNNDSNKIELSSGRIAFSSGQISSNGDAIFNGLSCTSGEMSNLEVANVLTSNGASTFTKSIIMPGFVFQDGQFTDTYLTNWTSPSLTLGSSSKIYLGGSSYYVKGDGAAKLNELEVSNSFTLSNNATVGGTLTVGKGFNLANTLVAATTDANSSIQLYLAQGALYLGSAASSYYINSNGSAVLNGLNISTLTLNGHTTLKTLDVYGMRFADKGDTATFTAPNNNGFISLGADSTLFLGSTSYYVKGNGEGSFSNLSSSVLSVEQLDTEDLYTDNFTTPNAMSFMSGTLSSIAEGEETSGQAVTNVSKRLTYAGQQLLTKADLTETNGLINAQLTTINTYITNNKAISDEMIIISDSEDGVTSNTKVWIDTSLGNGVVKILNADNEWTAISAVWT